MSTQANHYIIIGKKFTYEEFNELFKEEATKDAFLDSYCDSAFNQLVKNDHGLTLLYDGMNGEYAILGIVLAKTGVHEGFEKVHDLNFTTIDKSLTLHHLTVALQGITEVKYDDVRPYVLTHYR